MPETKSAGVARRVVAVLAMAALLKNCLLPRQISSARDAGARHRADMVSPGLGWDPGAARHYLKLGRASAGQAG
jgi:hypothetical protein